MTTKQEKEINDLIRKYKGKAVPDKEIHDLADKLGIDTPLVESYIYSLASKYLNIKKCYVVSKGIKEEEIPINENWMGDVRTIAKKQNRSVDEILKQLKYGMQIESEHTDKKDIQRKIALDHLAEKWNYYKELEKIEKSISIIIVDSNLIQKAIS